MGSKKKLIDCHTMEPRTFDKVPVMELSTSSSNDPVLTSPWLRYVGMA